MKHIHQYKRRDIGAKGKPYLVYACNLPLCSHYLHASLLENKFSLCYRCDKPFLLNKENLKLAFPHCDTCTHERKDDDIGRVETAGEAN
jgi:hypothetical protein